MEKYRSSSEGLWVRLSQAGASFLFAHPYFSFSNQSGVVRSQTGLPGRQGPPQGSYGTSLSCSFPSSMMGIATLTSRGVIRIKQSQIK